MEQRFASRVDLADDLLEFGRTATVVVGELGLGKTTLVRDIERRSRRASVIVACRQAAREIPFEPLQVVLDYFVRSGAVAQRRLNSSADMLALRDALAHWSSESPALVIVEDIHWCDAQSLSALTLLVDRLQDFPISWIFTSRPGYDEVDAFAHSIVALSRVLELPRLSDEEISTFAQSRSADRSLALADLVKESRGNPLFALILADASRAGDSADVIITSQVADLTDSERHVAEALAVADRPLERSTLSVLAEQAVQSLDDPLKTLVARGIVTADSDTVGLRHAVWQPALHSSIPQNRLQRYHRVLAGLSVDQVERARHLSLAGDAARAREIFSELAWEALLRGFRAEAGEHVQAALATDTNVDGLASDEALFAMRRLLQYFKTSPAVPLPYDRRRTDWQDLPPGAHARIGLAHSNFYKTLGDGRQGEGDWLERLAVNVLEPRIVSRLLHRASSLLVHAGNLHDAMRCSQRAIDVAVDGGFPSEQLVAEAFHASLHMRETRSANWQQLGRLMDRAYDQQDYEAASHIAVVAIGLGIGHDPEYALALCDRALAMPGFPYLLRAGLTMSRAHLLIPMGRFDEALVSVRPFGVVSGELDVQNLSSYYYARITASSFLGLFGDANDALKEWNDLGYPDRAGSVSYAAMHLAELQGDYATAIQHCEEGIRRYPSRAANPPAVVQSAARLAFLAKDPRVYELYRANCCDRESATNLPSQLVCEGYAAAYEGRAKEAADLLVEGSATWPPWDRAYTLLHAGQLTRNADFLTQAASGFAESGAGFLVERTQAIAKELKLQTRAPSSSGDLSHRERSVALLVAAGRTNPEIAHELSISRRTVETHVANILNKLNVRSRIDIAVRIAKVVS